MQQLCNQLSGSLCYDLCGILGVLFLSLPGMFSFACGTVFISCTIDLVH